MAFFLKNGQGLLLVGQIILYIFLKIELNFPRHVRVEVFLYRSFSFISYILRNNPNADSLNIPLVLQYLCSKAGFWLGIALTFHYLCGLIGHLSGK